MVTILDIVKRALIKSVESPSGAEAHSHIEHYTDGLTAVPFKDPT
jgi:hypothetical protein